MNHLSLFIAKKYFFSSKKKNFINIIAIISMIIVAICTASLIVVLSVFNGLEGLLRSLYSTFDPQIKIEATSGKTFEVNSDFIKKINEVEGVSIVTEVIEDYVYVKYRNSNMVVILKGVSDNFLDQSRIDKAIVGGDLKLTDQALNYAIVGQGIQFSLSITLQNELNPLQIYYVKDIKSGSIDLSNQYSMKNIMISSVFSVEKSYDDNYIFVPLRFAKSLLNSLDKRTSLEIMTHSDYDVDKVKTRLKELLGDKFSVKNNDEQHADLYKLLKLEKLFVFFVFILILFIGSINIFFSLSMLAINKKRDITILYSLGATHHIIKKVFIYEGIIISLVGASLGVLIGSMVCIAQQQYGLVSMGISTSIFENYPVEMKPIDFIATFVGVLLISFMISYRPSVIATKFVEIQDL